MHPRRRETPRGLSGASRSGLIVMLNPWDIGSARVLESLGFPGLGHHQLRQRRGHGAYRLRARRDELLRHVEALVATVSVPLSVDAERCMSPSNGSRRRRRPDAAAWC